MATNLNEKHLESLKVAELLIENHYFPSSVNRSFYGCIQFFLYIITKRLKIDRKKFDADRYQNANADGKIKGTHDYAFSVILDKLKDGDFNDYKWFQQEFPKFKKMRTRADYFDDEVGDNVARDALQTSNSLINIVNCKIKR